MFYHLLESSRWYNIWSNIGFGEEIGIIEIKTCTLSAALFAYVALGEKTLHQDINKP